MDTPGGDRRRPVPALARRPSEASSIRRRPSSRPRASSTFRFNVAAAGPPSRPASFRERRFAPPTPASDPPRHFREWWQSGAEPGAAGGALNSGAPTFVKLGTSSEGRRVGHRCSVPDYAKKKSPAGCSCLAKERL